MISPHRSAAGHFAHGPQSFTKYAGSRKRLSGTKWRTARGRITPRAVLSFFGTSSDRAQPASFATAVSGTLAASATIATPSAALVDRNSGYPGTPDRKSTRLNSSHG